MSNRETIFGQEVRLDLGRHARHARLFRNPAGEFWGGKILQFDGRTVTLDHAQKISAGLTPGAGDLIGWATMTITPEMVGKRVAIFVSGELKVDRKKLEPDQIKWADAVNAAGGRAAGIWTLEDARKLVAVG